MLWTFVYYFFRRSEPYYYSCKSVYLNAPAIYVLLNMCIFKVIHFIFETSKTVERYSEKKKKETTKLFTTLQVKIWF